MNKGIGVCFTILAGVFLIFLPFVLMWGVGWIDLQSLGWILLAVLCIIAGLQALNLGLVRVTWGKRVKELERKVN